MKRATRDVRAEERERDWHAERCRLAAGEGGIGAFVLDAAPRYEYEEEERERHERETTPDVLEMMSGRER